MIAKFKKGEFDRIWVEFTNGYHQEFGPTADQEEIASYYLSTLKPRISFLFWVNFPEPEDLKQFTQWQLKHPLDHHKLPKNWRRWGESNERLYQIYTFYGPAKKYRRAIKAVINHFDRYGAEWQIKVAAEEDQMIYAVGAKNLGADFWGPRAIKEKDISFFFRVN